MSVITQQCLVGILTHKSEGSWHNVHDLTFLKIMCFPAQPPSYLSQTLSLTQVAEFWLLDGLTLNHHTECFPSC